MLRSTFRVETPHLVHRFACGPLKVRYVSFDEVRVRARKGLRDLIPHIAKPLLGLLPERLLASVTGRGNRPG